ncbi:PREDICTED: anthocyanidin 5,3-O-glucosyltransferase-like [Fragaria vesca subsp. vesca]|uniref:anthocyanidin 5,3-O-glucosyltransferase-like n=1 Tax=Fragaria vesca subsp. vesca TaxID=101020 RepID=UPI0002C3491F|nr:PREDICTED: anthocyanidin 5,3-O-glucosyltransferase-like [Fragaria vesca subsp. vesca]
MAANTLVLYAAPGMGHMISMVELGKLILKHYSHKFSVTVLYTTGSLVDTPTIPAYIDRITQSHPSISFHCFPRAAVINHHNQTLSMAALMFEFIRQNDPNVRLALQEISKTCQVRAFIIDLFCSSSMAIAKELNIPTFYFYTSGAAALAAFLYFPTIHARVNQSFKDMRDTAFEFPGLESPLRAVHMPEPMLDQNDPAYSDLVYFCSHLALSDGIIANTFEELETPAVIKAISEGRCVPHAPIPPVYYIGPLLDKEKASGSVNSDEECLLWLDKQPSRSVVYLCFGSRGSFSEAQVREIANGLERSDQRFLWVVKKPPVDNTKQIHGVEDFDLDALLPEGFLERTIERGLVVKSWAPQVTVLKKEAVGGFVTHCGWNSVLESVMAGVPMVAWPLYAEQHLNRSALVKEIKMAIDVEQREEDGFVTGDEVERRVRELMESENGRKLRERSLKLGEVALGALGEHGSSRRALANFVNAIQ